MFCLCKLFRGCGKRKDCHKHKRSESLRYCDNFNVWPGLWGRHDRDCGCGKSRDCGYERHHDCGCEKSRDCGCERHRDRGHDCGCGK